jgi:16S rRNA (guanine(1405)-N(7))-methyltransferase
VRTNADDADTVIERLLATAKYRHIHPDTIADVVHQEAAHATGKSDLERRTRGKLHKVVGGYLFTGRSGRLLRGMDEDVIRDPARLREQCLSVLGTHFSSAERLPDLARFYPAVFGLTGMPRTIADIACALNPFSLPWLRDVTGAGYVGYDLNRTYTELAETFFARAYPDCGIQYRDVLVEPQAITADVALLLKTYHSIEDRRAGAGLRLVEDLGTTHIVISFPVKAMHGRIARFPLRHIAELRALAERKGWVFQQAALPTENLVAITKGAGAGEVMP